MTKRRYVWIDVLKLLGMVAIYTGHFIPQAGFLNDFVFRYHVALFFFVSGFFASNYMKKYSLGKMVAKKIKELLVPYVAFGLVTSVLFSVYWLLQGALPEGYTRKEYFDAVLRCFLGVREDMIYFGSMWFVPCLFLTEIVYYLLKKCTESNLLIVLIAIAFRVAYVEFSRPFVFSANWMLHYMIYYCLGDILFTYYKKNGFPNTKIPAFAGTACVIGFIFVLLGDWGALFSWKEMLPVESLTNGVLVRYISQFVQIGVSFVLIGANIVFAISLSRIQLLGDLGRYTLIYCGAEGIVKKAFEIFTGICISKLGIDLLGSPACTVLWSIVLIFCIYAVIQIVALWKKRVRCKMLIR